MADHRTCGCDEARFLRAENLRLQGALELVRATVAVFAPTSIPVASRCSAHDNCFGLVCELPVGHSGAHRCGETGWY